jgi:predicted regulator of Ras-like GTPase activity (Roadblock/LC7/MglB family)
MPVRGILQSILDTVEGAMAAVIMAYDGIAIDEIAVEQSGYDIQLLSVEYATVLKEIKRAVEIIKMGSLQEVVVSTEKISVIVKILTDDLFAALIMSRDGNTGKGRYMLKLTSFDILRELS